MVATGEPLQSVANVLCSEIETALPDVACSLIRVDRCGMIRPLAAPQFPPEYADSFEGRIIGPFVGSCGSAIYLREPVTVTSIAADPRWAPFKAIPLAVGVRACWSTPVLNSSGTAIGALALYFRTERGPNAAEQSLVRLCIRLCSIALEREERIQDHERRANRDALTGLPNQGAFKSVLEKLPCDTPGAWAIMLFDLDYLKATNDSLGHGTGNALIQTVASRLAAAAGSDPTFRIGGDEMAVLIQAPEALRDLHAMAARFIEQIVVAADCDGHVIIPSATVGAALLGPGDAPDIVFRNADLALYHAKDQARGTFVEYWPGIGTRISKRLSAIETLNEALDDHRIDAHYQPVMRIDTGEIIGVEALSRLITREGETVSARHFSDAIADARIAERLTGQMLPIVAADVRNWVAAGIPFQHVGINISAADLRRRTLERELSSILEAHGVPITCVILEVSEATYVSARDQTVAKAVQGIRRAGFRVALDDFGTGAASLTRLITMPVDAIKIDRGFVARLRPGDPSMAIIRALLDIGRELDIRVIAEGIETAEQAEILVQLGCRLGQGYYYSRPTNRCDMLRLLQRHGQGVAGAVPLRPTAEHSEQWARTG